MSANPLTFSCILNVLKTDDLKSHYNFLIYELENQNHGLKIEPDFDSLHITLMVAKSPISFPFLQELLSLIKNVVPPEVCPTPKGFDLFGPDKDKLVLKLDCPELVECNRKIIEHTRARGIATSEFDYSPHMTLGKVNKQKIYYPEVKQIPIVVGSLQYTHDNDGF